MDEKSTEKGEIKDENRKVKGRKIGKIRLCCYFVWPLSFYLSGLGGLPGVWTPASIAIRVIEVHNPPPPPLPPRKGDNTQGYRTGIHVHVCNLSIPRWNVYILLWIGSVV